MTATIRGAIALIITISAPSFAQPLHDPRTPTSPAEKARMEAKRLYGAGLLYERKSRLLEALRSFEEAARLDPDSISVRRALVPLYLALDRLDDARKAADLVLERDPDDFRTAYALGRHMRALGNRPDAIRFLTFATKAKQLKDRPDLGSLIWYDLAVLRELEGQLTEAEAALGVVNDLLARPSVLGELTGAPVEEIRTQAAEVQERYGQVSLKLKKIPQARRAFDAARRLDPTRSSRLAFDLARVYRDAGLNAEALTQLNDYLRSMPSGIEPYEMKIQIQRALGKKAEVLIDLGAASDRDPNNIPLRLLLAKELIAAKQIVRAEEVYTELLTKSMTADVFEGLFGLYVEQGVLGATKVLTRLDRAVAGAIGKKGEGGDASMAASARAMLTVLRNKPPLVRLLLEAALGSLRPGQLQYATKITLGSLAARTNELGTAEKLYRACMDVRGDDLGGAEAELYSGLIQVLQMQHKNAEVIELARKGLARAQDTNRIMFHRALAYAALALGKKKEALTAADAAVKESDKEQIVRSRTLRASILCEMGEGEKALEECRSLIKEYNSASDLREARRSLSHTYQSLGRHDESEAELERILELDPNDATVNNDLGYGLADRNKDLDRAEKLIRKALELDRKERASGTAFDADAGEDNAAYIDSLGWVLFRRGKFDEARRELERAAKMKQGADPVIWDHLGDVYFKLKQPTRAKEAWQKALSLFEVGARPAGDPRAKEIKVKLGTTVP